MTKRLDVALVQAGLAPSRNKAQELIAAGEVEVLSSRNEWSVTHQASLSVSSEQFRVRPDATTLRYVSRGGLKLEHALQKLKLDVRGWRCLDIGLSTGGFADCLLQQGASEVCGIDVGHGQLDSRMKNDARLLSFEGLHVKDLAQNVRVGEWLAVRPFELCVADLSFISFVRICPELAPLVPQRLLALIKPQFEVGPENLDKRGVADPSLFDDVQGRVLRVLEKCGFSVADYFASSVKGQDGNQEFFVFAHRRQSPVA